MAVSVFISIADKESTAPDRLAGSFPHFPVTKYINRSYSILKNLQACLSFCPKKNFCLFIRDDTVTRFTSEEIELLIKDIIKNEEFDIYYLCKWMDKCEKYSGYRQVGKIFSSTRTFAPSGLQAIIVNPSFFETISKYTSDAQVLSEISSGKALAFCCLPNAFEFDISQKKENSDLLKLYQCASVFPSAPRTVTSFLETKNEKKVPARYDPPVKTKPVSKSIYESIDSMDYMFLVKILVLLTIASLVFSFFSKKKA